MPDPVLNHFELLGQPARPWLDPEALKSEYLRRCALVHPDRVHHHEAGSRAVANEDASALNKAYQVLSNPRSRAQHLLQLLDGGNLPAGNKLPPLLTDLFFDLSTRLREADALAAQTAAATSPILKAGIFTKISELMPKLDSLWQSVQEESDRSLKELQELDASWVGTAEPITASKPSQEMILKMQGIVEKLGYTAKWLVQIQERRLKLTL